MNKLQLHIEPSFESHDFQVRIIIDEIDVFPELLGLDPNDFFKQELDKENNTVIVARCECGVIGCFDTTITIEYPSTSTIKWKVSNFEEYIFLKKDYLQAIEEGINDKTWETFERRTERLIGSQLIHYKYLNDYKLDWVSLLSEDSEIKISYSKQNPKGYTDQEFIKIKWDGKNSEIAIQKVITLRDESGKFKKIN